MSDVPFSPDKSESPRFSGRAVVALATDPERSKKTGKVLIVTDLSREYEFEDVDGRQPGSLREQLGV